MKILVLNAGSSSQKSCLYEVKETLPENPLEPIWEAGIDWTHHEGWVELKVKTNRGQTIAEEFQLESRSTTVSRMLQTLSQGPTQVIEDLHEIDIVGHRVVHGGQEYQQSTLITPEVKATISRLAVFAPVHNPANLEGIEAIEQVLGDIPQVAVFDTAFHAHLPPASYIYPGPYEWLQQGIRRYGFHGISHQYCALRAAQLLNQDLADLRLITCHLGNGCSLAAIRKGQSVDTTMGFTPLEGLMMGTRSGSIDPGILIHLLRESPDLSAEKLDRLLNRGSGLLGVSGVSADLRLIMDAVASGNERAQLALDIYIHRLRSFIGALLPSLEGLDALVFTAGVGEHSAIVREETCKAFEFLGLQLDREKNQRSPVDADIATNDSAVRVLVIHTQEDWAIAQECWRIWHKPNEPR